MRAYILLLVVAAAATYLLTPVARRLAFSWGAITAVRARDVHHEPTPRLGGLAMFLGLLVGTLLASRLGFLHSVFDNPHPVIGIVGGAAIVCALGVADDIWDLDWLTKLMGQVLAAVFLAWQGVLLYQMPLLGVVAWSGRVSTFVTVLSVVVAMNAVNFVDGLDGLAAGMVAIGGSAFMAYSYLLTVSTSENDYASLATLVLALLVGICVGFLPHNFYPARIFMGDSGALLLGIVIAAAGIVVTPARSPRASRSPRSCRCCCRWRCSSCRRSPWRWPSCAASAPATRRSTPTPAPCTTGCWRSGTRTGARWRSCTCGRRCSPSGRRRSCAGRRRPCSSRWRSASSSPPC